MIFGKNTVYPIQRLPVVIPIGIQTETGVEEIGFDVSAWVKKWPDIEVEVWHRLPGQTEAYLTKSRREENIVYWEVSSTDTQTPGMGKVELMGILPDGRKLSGSTDTLIRETICASTQDPPDAPPTWVDTVREMVGEDAIAEAVEDYMAANPIDAGGVKTVNGVSPDEAGNVAIDTDSGVTSWNDLTDRPFYEDVVGNVLYDEQDVDFSAKEDSPNGAVRVFDDEVVGDGDVLRIVVDDVTYDLTCEFEWLVEELGIYQKTVEPEDGKFAIYNGYMQFADKGAHSVKIVKVESDVKTLDAKYLPKDIQHAAGYKKDNGGEIFNHYDNSRAIGEYSHAEGYDTAATGRVSHAEGHNTYASGDYSHAEGKDTFATNLNSHAEGYATTAYGESSHAEGGGTSAKDKYSHAEGYATTAYGESSHAEGCGTKAIGENQHVQGKFNVEDTEGKYAHIVGNGSGVAACSNAHTLDWDGNAWFAGSVEGTAVILKSTTEGSSKRITITADDNLKLTATDEDGNSAEIGGSGGGGGGVKTVNGVEPDEDGNVAISAEDATARTAAEKAQTTADEAHTTAGQALIYAENATDRLDRVEVAVNTAVKTVNGVRPDENGDVTINDTVVDAAHWEATSWTNGNFNSATYANAVWVAGGDSGLLYSTDGKNWERCMTISCYSPAYANGLWVVGRSDDMMMYSTDGRNWGNECTGDCLGCYSPTYADGLWVAGSCTGGGLTYSKDGKAWTQSNITSGSFYSPTYGDGLWIAGSENKGLWRSTDGETWTQSDITSGNYYSPTYADDLWVAGSSSGLWYSTNGMIWTQDAGTMGVCYSPIYADGLWVAGGEYCPWYSTNGENWLMSDGAGQCYSPIYAGGLWIAGSEIQGLIYSENGRTWTVSDINQHICHCYSPAYGDGLLVAGSYEGGLWYASSIDKYVTPEALDAALSNLTLTSPGGTKYRITVDDDGVLSAMEVSDS